MLSQYTFDVRGSISGWENDLTVWDSPALRAVYGIDSDPGARDTWEANIGYSDRPTITYVPLAGEEFSNRVMSPIPPETIIYLSQSGWSINRLLECCVQQLGNTRNAPIHDIRSADSWDAVIFRTVSELLKKFQDAGRLQLGIEVDPEHQFAYLYPPQDIEGFADELKQLTDLLGIPPEAKRVKIVPTQKPRMKEAELIMQTRSLLGVLNALAQDITPPEAHVESGQVLMTLRDEEGTTTQPWLDVSYSRLPKANSFVQVRFNGYWWSIPNADWKSKRTFALLTYLFSLQATGTAAQLPVVTIQAGGG